MVIGWQSLIEKKRHEIYENTMFCILDTLVLECWGHVPFKVLLINQITFLLSPYSLCLELAHLVDVFPLQLDLSSHYHKGIGEKEFLRWI